MSLDKSIEHGKEKRKQYRKSAAIDRSCRPGGSCPYCQRGRRHRHMKQIASAKERQDDDSR